MYVPVVIRRPSVGPVIHGASAHIAYTTAVTMPFAQIPVYFVWL